MGKTQALARKLDFLLTSHNEWKAPQWAAQKMEEKTTRQECIGTKVSFQKVATTMANGQLLKSENYKDQKAHGQANLLLSKISHGLFEVEA